MKFILLKVFWSGFKDRRTPKSQELVRWSLRRWMSVNGVELASVFFSPSQQEKLCFFPPSPFLSRLTRCFRETDGIKALLQALLCPRKP
jgi:hypothetical protein